MFIQRRMFNTWLHVVIASLAITLGTLVPQSSPAREYQHLVILGDPHLPGEKLVAKEQALQNINAWEDADMIIPLGDVCKELGTDEEYAAVKAFFAKTSKPVHPVVGNHDYLYADNLNVKGKKEKAVTETRTKKLSKFREVFSLSDASYSKDVGGYHLVFLSPDSPEYLSALSAKQLLWLREDLQKSRKQPTIIFFHAPLTGTLRSYNKYSNTSDFIAQPDAAISETLKDNPQVFLWVSGHTHTSPAEESFASAINLYDNRVMNIHNPDMERETILTNSLFLYPDKVVIKMYNHKKQVWVKNLERSVVRPSL